MPSGEDGLGRVSDERGQEQAMKRLAVLPEAKKRTGEAVAGDRHPCFPAGFSQRETPESRRAQAAKQGRFSTESKEVPVERRRAWAKKRSRNAVAREARGILLGSVERSRFSLQS